MSVQIYLFEDSHLESFHPLTLTRPLWDLRLGTCTIAEKWTLEFPRAFLLGEVRTELAGVFNQDIQSADGTIESSIFINSRFLPEYPLIDSLTLWMKKPDHEVLFIHESKNYRKREIIAYCIPEYVQEYHISTILEELKSGNEIEEQFLSRDTNKKRLISALASIPLSRPWDLLSRNGEEIARDFNRLIDNETSGFRIGTHSGFHASSFVTDEAMFAMHKESVVEPGVTIHNSEGPVILGKGAHIMSGSQLRGPVSIGEGAILKMGALIYKDTTIGPYCKVGGEVNNTIFHSHSNKAHHGYCGNSIIGEWVNIGAGSTTANLRGNYSEIKIVDWASKSHIDTGRQFLGSIIGDHVKAGIHSMLNTGTIIGPVSLLYGSRFAPSFIPGFSWVNADTGEITRYEFEKALTDMARMMERRNVGLSDEYIRMMTHLSGVITGF